MCFWEASNFLAKSNIIFRWIYFYHFWFLHVSLWFSETNNDCLCDTFIFNKLPKLFCYLYKLNLYCFGVFDVQWVVKGAVDVDIGANPSAEGGEDEGVDDQAVKVVDIVDTFRLQVWQN